MQTLKRLEKELKKNFFPKYETKKFFWLFGVDFFLEVKNSEAKRIAINLLENHFPIKKNILSFLIKKEFLPKVEIKIPKGTSLLIVGNRIKIFNFKEKKVFTLSKQDSLKKEILGRNKASKIIKNINKIDLKGNVLEEKFLFPTEKLNDQDILNMYEKLLLIYKTEFQEDNTSKFLKASKKRFGKIDNEAIFKEELKKDTKINSSFVHGDFWRGNILKYKNRLFLIDWANSGKGSLVEDLIHYFWIEFLKTSKINKKLFLEMRNLTIKKLGISKKEFKKNISLEFTLIKIFREKKLKKKFRQFQKLIFKLSFK